MDYYFDSYSHFGIHEEMLKDEVRTLSYRNAIYRNRHLFQDKVVLDVGCGTGILCMFAVNAGAKLVIGVDMSNILNQTQKIIKDNGMEDKIVLLKGKMEQVQLPVEKVDIIISEWMGYFLLYESMLFTVIYARDRYLAPGGLIFPDKATLYLSAIEDAQYKEEKIGFWDNVYGFNMSCIKEWALREPLVDIVEAKAVIANEVAVKQINILTITKEELSFRNIPFELTIKKTDFLHAFLGYFSVSFPCDDKREDGNNEKGINVKPVKFSTGPYDKYTHWKQAVFYIADDLKVEEGDVITGEFSCEPNEKNHRDLNIKISWNHNDKKDEMEYLMC